MIRDLLHALRVQRRRVGATAAIVVTLAIGLGAVTAIASLVDAVLYKGLGYPAGERLVEMRQTMDVLRESPNPRLQAIWNRIPVSYQNTVDWRRDSRTLSGIGLYADTAVTLEGGGEPEAVEAAAVDAELLATLAVEPIVGRSFTADEVAARESLVLLGHALWQRAWGSDRGVVGTTVRLDGEPHTVVGVMPEGFEIVGGRNDRLWTLLQLEDADLAARNNQRLLSIARLADGATFEEAVAELDRLAAAQAETWPDTNDGLGVRLQPLRDVVIGQDSRAAVPVLVAAVVVVLAVACVNVAHLLLVQAHRRRDEWAVRRALGAGRGRLVRQVLIESLVPALLGGGLGVLVAVVGRDLLLAWLPVELPRADTIPIDGRVLLVALAASLLSAILCGLPSAWTSASLALRRGRGAPAASGGGFRLHELLVVAEIALTLVLASAAGLLGHSFLRLSAVDPGFRVDDLVVQDIRLPGWSYPDEIRRQGFAETLVERLGALPGVGSVALTSKLPFAGPALVAGFSIPGTESADGDWTQGPSASLKFVTPDYFATLGIAVEAGRGFTDADRPERGRVVVINRTLAERGWPSVDPIGRTLVFSEHELTVVGVVADIRHDGLSKEPGALMYFPWRQRVDLPVMADQVTVVLEPTGDGSDWAASVRDVVRAIDPALPLPAATSVEALMADSLAVPRSRAALVTLLAGLALVLALIGTYAVMAFSVGRRTREIGLRMALGADGPRVVRQVLARVVVLTLAGVTLGLVGAVAGARFLESLLWGVETTDGSTLAGAALALTLVGVGAGLLPALRASRIAPVDALREE
ncbi:MAG: ADOP family duplicated permease [Acidobacteriota bacterium]